MQTQTEGAGAQFADQKLLLSGTIVAQDGEQFLSLMMGVEGVETAPVTAEGTLEELPDMIGELIDALQERYMEHIVRQAAQKKRKTTRRARKRQTRSAAKPAGDTEEEDREGEAAETPPEDDQGEKQEEAAEEPEGPAQASFLEGVQF
jgi:hypothetical protein